MSDIIFELHAIQIGGKYSNSIINSSMQTQNFLIANCTNHNINECLKHFPSLIEYFNNFQQLQMNSPLYVPLEHFSYKFISEIQINDFSVSSRQMYLLPQIFKIKFYYNVLNHINNYYPLSSEMLYELLNEINLQKENLFTSNNLRICFISDNYNKCMEKLFKNFDLTQFENKIHTFLTKESYEYIFIAKFNKNFCLPRNSKWEKEGILQLRMNNGKGYIVNNFGLNCTLKRYTDFECSDNVNNFSFTIADVDYSDESLLICTNQLFPDKFRMESLIYKKDINHYFYDLNIPDED